MNRQVRSDDVAKSFYILTECKLLTLRHGSLRPQIAIGRGADLAVYGQEFNRNSGFSTLPNTKDAWRKQSGGFRLDYLPTKEDTLTFRAIFPMALAATRRS